MGCALCRTCVSKQKRRTVEDPFDLDLMVIHKNVTVMGYPSSGIEACYRNPYDDAKAFLDKKFGSSYLVVNLCSESNRQYDPTAYFQGRCVRIPFPDHCACTLEEIPAFIKMAMEYILFFKFPLSRTIAVVDSSTSRSSTQNVDSTRFSSVTSNKDVQKGRGIDSSKEHNPSDVPDGSVGKSAHNNNNNKDHFDDIREEESHQQRREEGGMVVIHCKAGKGRSGLMACVLLMAVNPRDCPTAERAMSYYATSRTHDGKGLTIPSQRRYVEYYEQLRRLSSGEMPSVIPAISLQSIAVYGLWRHVEKAEVVRIRVGHYTSSDVVQFSLDPQKAEAHDGVQIRKRKDIDGVEISFQSSKLSLLKRLQGDVRIDFLKSGTGKAVWLASLTFHTLFVKPFYSYKEIDKLYKVKGASEGSHGISLVYSNLAPSFSDGAGFGSNFFQVESRLTDEDDVHGSFPPSSSRSPPKPSDYSLVSSTLYSAPGSLTLKMKTPTTATSTADRRPHDPSHQHHAPTTFPKWVPCEVRVARNEDEDGDELTAFKSNPSVDFQRNETSTRLDESRAAAPTAEGRGAPTGNTSSNQSSMSSSFASSVSAPTSAAKKAPAATKRGADLSPLDDPML